MISVRRLGGLLLCFQLAHISLIRNEATIALGEIRSSFESEGVGLDFRLLAAPRLEGSEVVEVKG